MLRQALEISLRFPGASSEAMARRKSLTYLFFLRTIKTAPRTTNATPIAIKIHTGATEI
jgi:hypothetical protein